MAPTGSSIFAVRSMKIAATTTRTPAIAPMSAAPPLLTKAQGAVIATSPASIPFTSMLGSGLP